MDCAKHRFETADWHGQQRAQRERNEFYDLRVKECLARLEKDFKAGAQSMEVWPQVKLHYIGLVDHHQPELAETFFSSVTTKILHHSYFHNNFIFVRPAVSTEYIENDDLAHLKDAKPTYRACYPQHETLRHTVAQLLKDFGLQCEFADFERDVHNVHGVMAVRLATTKLRANFPVQVLSSLFFRDRAAYVVGNAIKDLVAANIFPGDMLWKNFGVTRNGKVVFYDYDEIAHITDCNFRRVLAPRNQEEEMSGVIWYTAGPKDVFPETFGPFLLGSPAVRAVFMQHHADLLDAVFWQERKDCIAAGHVHDVFPYAREKRFAYQQLSKFKETV